MRVLFRHKKKMLAFFLATMGLVVLGLIFLPRTYTSDAQLFVRIGRESVGLDPTATVQETVNVSDSRESEINSEVEILRGRVLLEDVVDELGAETVLYVSNDGQSAGWFDALMVPFDVAKTWLTGEISLRERAVRKLEKSIHVSSPRRSNVLVVRAEGRDPKHAQRILQAFVDAYIMRHAKANRTYGSHDFFVEQSQLLADQLENAHAELRDAKNAMTLISMEGHRDNIQAQAATIESAIQENARALAHSEAKVAALTKALQELPAELASEETEGLPNVAADYMRNELYKLQIEEKEANSRFTSLHPTVIALRRQVADTQSILDEQQDSRRQSVRKLNVVYQEVQTELMSAQATAAAQRAEAESLQRQFDDVRAKFKELNDNEFRITELTRQAELIEASYRDYIVSREQARVDEALASGRISNVNVVQQASLVDKPSSPQARLSLIVGLVLATMGSVLLAFTCEHFDPSLKTSEQIEHELGIPVLFAVPRSRRHSLLPS